MKKSEENKCNECKHGWQNQLKDKMEERKRQRNTHIPKYFRETWSRKIEGIEERVSELTAKKFSVVPRSTRNKNNVQ